MSEELKQIELVANAPEARPSTSFDLWLMRGDDMHKIVEGSDVTIMFSHLAGEPADKWKMLAIPRDTITEKKTFLALHRSMTEFARGQGWLEAPAEKQPIRRGTMTIPIKPPSPPLEQ